MPEATTRKQKVRYRYDALGRRVTRNFGGGRDVTKFTYDGQDILVDDNFGTQTKYLNGAGIDNKLRQTTGSSANYFLTDHQLSTYGLTNSAGSLSASQTFDSYGNISNNSFPSRYQYTGREYDSFTGIYHYRSRACDSNLGRFISEDPSGFVGGTNLYAYVGNNPTQFTDPLGLWPSLWPFNFHKDITERALAGYASPEQIAALANEQYPFDSNTQGTAYSPMHAMTRPGQSPQDARNEANAYVRRQICLARKLKSMALPQAGLPYLGRAMHTMQDAASPAHFDFRPAWPNTFWNEAAQSSPPFGHHYVEQFMPQPGGISDQNTRRVWDYYNGAPMPGDFFPDAYDTPSGSVYSPMKTPKTIGGGNCDCQ